MSASKIFKNVSDSLAADRVTIEPNGNLDSYINKVKEAASNGDINALNSASKATLKVLDDVVAKVSSFVPLGDMIPKVINPTKQSDAEPVVDGEQYSRLGQLLDLPTSTKSASNYDISDKLASGVKKLLTRELVMPGKKYRVSTGLQNGSVADKAGIKNPISGLMDGIWTPDVVTYGDVHNPANRSLTPRTSVETLERDSKNIEGLTSRTGKLIKATIRGERSDDTSDYQDEILGGGYDTDVKLPHWGYLSGLSEIGIGTDFYWGVELGNPEMEGLSRQGKKIKITSHAPRNPFINKNYANGLSDSAGFNSTGEDDLMCYIPISGYSLSNQFTGIMDQLDLGERMSLQVPIGFAYPSTIDFDVFDTDIYIWERYLRYYYDVVYGGNNLGPGVVLPYKNACSTIKISVFYQTGQLYMSQKFYCIPDLTLPLTGTQDKLTKEHHLTWHIYGQSDLQVKKVNAKFIEHEKLGYQTVM